jgi:hypothetical protein
LLRFVVCGADCIVVLPSYPGLQLRALACQPMPDAIREVARLLVMGIRLHPGNPGRLPPDQHHIARAAVSRGVFYSKKPLSPPQLSFHGRSVIRHPRSDHPSEVPLPGRNG